MLEEIGIVKEEQWFIDSPEKNMLCGRLRMPGNQDITVAAMD